MAKGRDIAIIGAGIGGLTAAIALRRIGARVTVHEQAAEIGEVGAGLQLGPNAMAVLDRLGVAPEVLRRGGRPKQVDLRDGVTGQPLATYPLGGDMIRRFGQPFINIHRADLIAVLEHAARDAGVEMSLGRRVSTIADTDPPCFHFEDGGETRAEIGILADGVKSGARATLFGGRNPQFSGHIAWRMTLPLPSGWPQTVIVWLAPGRHVVSYPLRGTMLNVVAVENCGERAEEGWRVQGDPAVLRERFGTMHADVRALLEPVEHVYKWGLYGHGRLESWSMGNVALLGDACHPMLPFLAQGAGMAIEDAWVLADELDGAEEIAPALKRYTARRIDRASRVQAASRRNGLLYHAGGLQRPGRNLGFRLLNRFAPGQIRTRFDWLYGVDVTKD